MTRGSRAAGLAVLLFLTADSARAQQTGQTVMPSMAPEPHRLADSIKFLAGGALGLATHEGGHLLLDVAFDADPSIKRVDFGAVPFFAIAHRGDLSPRREFLVSSAGFLVQAVTSEWLLTRHPALRDQHAPLAKGTFAFDELTSIGYGIVAFAEAGPPERDTRGMSHSIGVSERTIGALVIAPAAFDAYRYFHPDSQWAKWASRLVKAGTLLLVVK